MHGSVAKRNRARLRVRRSGAAKAIMRRAPARRDRRDSDVAQPMAGRGPPGSHKQSPRRSRLHASYQPNGGKPLDQLETGTEWDTYRRTDRVGLLLVSSEQFPFRYPGGGHAGVQRGDAMAVSTAIEGLDIVEVAARLGCVLPGLRRAGSSARAWSGRVRPWIRCRLDLPCRLALGSVWLDGHV